MSNTNADNKQGKIIKFADHIFGLPDSENKLKA